MAAVDWVAEHGDGLVGLSADEAASRVLDAGLTPRRLAPDSVVTAEFRSDRVDLVADRAGVVSDVRAG